MLTRGQQKSIHTDRVVLVPGPSDEVDTVRWIYRTFVEDARPEREIAAMLNASNLRTDLDRLWTRGTVHQVLINEKYVGDNVWNRISCKLHGKRVRNGRDMWVRRDAAFEAVVDRLLFDAAQVIIQERSAGFRTMRCSTYCAVPSRITDICLAWSSTRRTMLPPAARTSFALEA